MQEDTSDYVADLERRLDIPVNVEELDARSFDGDQTVVFLITALVGGVSAGVLAKMGEDLWDGIRGIARSLRRVKRQDKTVRTFAVIVQDGPDGPVRFRCEVTEDLTAAELAEAFRLTVAGFQTGTSIHVIESDDGTEVRILPPGSGRSV
ncbi:hypothetical protein ACFCV3_11610 [Kribbella sp. NPDC056345]|uniref:hypothetical protein n=1 Tax=Kribbella sp. NPDC056345 TaxID=3345789 RepID=UPI0035E1BDE8